MSKLIDGLKACRRSGVPLVSITSVDEPATVATVAATINNGSAILRHDIVRGFAPLTDSAQSALGEIVGDADPVMMTNPQTAISAFADRCPDRACLCLIGTGRWIEDKGSQQAIADSRDVLKGKGAMLVLIGGSGLSLPGDLGPDVVQLHDPAATPEQRREIAKQIHADAKAANPSMSDPDDAILTLEVSATRGLSAYGVEQSISLSMSKDGIDKDMLWNQWRSAINATRGLKVDTSKETAKDIGGLKALLDFATRLINGRTKPTAIIRVDEIEKVLAGASAGGIGDSSGSTQEIVGAILTYMQERKQRGIIAIGPPGSGKSLSSVAIGSLGGIPTVTLDLSALKGGIVGETGINTRRCLGVLEEVVGENAFWIATCNKLASLSPELKARFRLGTYFFDLPNAEERAAIWKIWLAKYPAVEGPLPNDEGWVGREIANCCEMANDLGITPKEAAEYIIPYSVQNAESLKELRQQASGRFLSASYPGKYVPPSLTTKAPEVTRKFQGVAG